MSSGSRPNDDIDRYFSEAHPNPNRSGCLDPDHLRSLARKERDIRDSGYDHLEQCSHCYREFLAQKQQLAGTGQWQRWWPAAAMIAIVLSGSAIYLARNQSEPRGAAEPRTQLARAEAVLDLRRYTVTRGEEQGTGAKPVRLSRRELALEILLPVGFEEGKYDLRLIDGNLQTIISQQVTSSLQDHIARIRTSVDLRHVPSGSYQLALRAPGEEWHLYPATIE